MSTDGPKEFRIQIRRDDNVPLFFENKEHEQYFDKLLEMKVVTPGPQQIADDVSRAARSPCGAPSPCLCVLLLIRAQQPSLSGVAFQHCIDRARFCLSGPADTGRMPRHSTNGAKKSTRNSS